MDPAVSDASPIISFARAESLHILQSVMTELIVPPAVYEELTGRGEDRPGAAAIAAANWVKRHAAPDPAEAEKFLPLHKGEREAIALAIELGRPLLVDERKAINAARRAGVEVYTSLRVLATAKSRGLLTEARPLLDRLCTYTFRLSQQLYDDFLRQVGESPLPSPIDDATIEPC